MNGESGNTAQQRTTHSLAATSHCQTQDGAKTRRIFSQWKSTSTTMDCFAGHRQSVRPVYHHLRFWNVDTWQSNNFIDVSLFGHSYMVRSIYPSSCLVGSVFASEMRDDMDEKEHQTFKVQGLLTCCKAPLDGNLQLSDENIWLFRVFRELYYPVVGVIRIHYRFYDPNETNRSILCSSRSYFVVRSSTA